MIHFTIKLRYKLDIKSLELLIQATRIIYGREFNTTKRAHKHHLQI